MSPRVLTIALLVGASSALGAQMPGTAAKQAAKNVAAQASARATMTPESQAPAAAPAAAKPAAQPAAVRQQGASSAPAKATPAKPAAKPAAADAKSAAAAPAEPKAKKRKGAKAPAGESGNAVVATGAAAVKPVVKDTVVPRVIMREAFTYDKSGRRDPFASLMATSDLRPTISDLRLTGILYDLSGRRPVAIMRDLTTKAQYRVTTGMTLGRMRVAQIKPKVVVFSIEEFGLNRQDSLMLGDSTKVRTK